MTTPPGWYPHPEKPDALRWWDGGQWTDHVRPAAAPQVQAPALAPPSRAQMQVLPPPVAIRRKTAFAITAMVLLLSGLLWFSIPLLAAASFIGTAVFAVLALNKQQGLRGLSVACLCLAPVGLIATLIWAASGAGTRGTNSEKVVPSPTPVVAADYTQLGERDLALIVKEPDSHKGERIVVFARITQFDSATGTCKFRASASAVQEEIASSFANSSIFSGGAGGVSCDQLKDFVEKDGVKVLATVLGPLTYDARLGGNLTVPEFRIDQIELVK